MDIEMNPFVFDLTTEVGFSLAVQSVLRLRAGSVLIMALCCSSFSVMRFAEFLFHPCDSSF